MKVLKFRTNINCASCIRAVSGFLQDVKGIESWEVQTEDPAKVLTVRGDALEADAVMAAVRDAGFDIAPTEATAS